MKEASINLANQVNAPIAGSSAAEIAFYRDHYESMGVKLNEVEFDVHARVQALDIQKHFCKGGRYHLVDVQLGDSKVESLLELGCGWGETCAYMTRYADHVVGMDIAIPTTLTQLRDPQLRFLDGNANAYLPFEDQSFDVVVAMMVIEHLFDPFRVLMEIERILKPNGVLIANLPLLTSVQNRMRLLMGQLPVTSTADWFERREWDGGHLHYFNMSTIHRWLAVQNMEISKYSAVGRWVDIKTKLLGLLAGEVSFIAIKKNR